MHLSKASRDGVEKFDAAGTPVASSAVFSGGNSGQSPIAVSSDGSTPFSTRPDVACVNICRAGTAVLEVPALSFDATVASVTASWSAPANLTGGQRVGHDTVTATGPGGAQKQLEVSGATATATPAATSSATGSPIATPGATSGTGLASTGAAALLGGALAVALLGGALALIGLRRRAS